MKKEIIIISEIKGIFLPYPISLKIKKEDIFLYPTDYTQKLENIKEIITGSEKGKSVKDSLIISHIMQKEKEKSIYLISEKEINIYEKRENLIRKIYNFFNPIRIIFSFVFSEIFKISKIIIIQNSRKNRFKVKRYIKIYSEMDFNETKRPIVFNNYYLEIEGHLSHWGKDIEDNKEYLNFFNTFLHGKFSSDLIEIKISFYWNSLENLALLFCKKKGWTKVLKKGTDTKYNEMKNLIEPLREEISNDDFDIPNLTVEEFKKSQLCTIKNNLTTKIRIRLLCEEIGLDYDHNVKYLIDLMSFIRNKFYHSGMPFFLLSKEIIKKEKYGSKSFDFQDLISKVSEFEILVQKIFLKTLNLIPEHLTDFNHTNRFIWKIDTSEIESENEINNSNLNYYKDIFKRLKRKKKYISLLKEMEEVIEPSINQLFQKDHIDGFLYRNKNCYRIQIGFNKEFGGIFESSNLLIDKLIENKFLFMAKTKNGMKLLFNFHIDFVEPQKSIRGIMKFKEFLRRFYKNQGIFSTLNLEIGF